MKVLLAPALLLHFATLVAAPLTVHLKTVGETSSCSGSIRAEGSETVEREFSGDGDLLMDLDRSVPWNLSVRSAGCWAAPVIVPPDAGSSLDVTLWPAAELVMTVASEAPSAKIADVALRIASVPGAASVLPAVELRCDRHDERWICGVPAIPLDVRVSVAGAVPHYLWEVKSSPGGRTDLGIVKLQRGASVSGWVAMADGTEPTNVTVELTPEGFAGPAADSSGAQRRAITVRANRRGFFQFPHTAPGTYRVTAKREGWSPATASAVEVEEGSERGLKGSLRIQPLARLEVAIQPPLAPDGSPWVVKVDRRVPMSTYITTVVKGEASPAGLWEHQGLPAETYDLSVRDHGGSVFHNRKVEVSSGMPLVVVTIESVAIRGRVRLGDEPLEATISFSGNDGAPVHLKTDADGIFAGVLPREGKWRVQLAPKDLPLRLRPTSIEVRRPDGEPAAVLNIDLPGNHVRGIVVDDAGKPADAVVSVIRGRSVDGYVNTDAEGRFDLPGVDEGDVVVEADADDAHAAVPHHVGEHSQEVRIVVQRAMNVSGVLIDPAGYPLAGALVRTSGVTIPSRGNIVSGPSGEFSVSIPMGTAAFDMVILTPSGVTKLITVTVPRDRRQLGEILLGRAVGSLRIRMIGSRGWPFVQSDQSTLVGLAALLPPPDGSPQRRGVTPDGLTLFVEAGTYTFCPERRPSDRCVSRVVSAGGETFVDAGGLFDPEIAAAPQ